MTKTSSSPGRRYLADGKSADTFRSRRKFKSCQPPALNIYTNDSTQLLVFQSHMKIKKRKPNTGKQIHELGFRMKIKFPILCWLLDLYPEIINISVLS
jgi:hypothetical protein